MHRMILAAVALVALVATATVRADDKAPSETDARLARMKALAGDWTLGDGKVAFTYRVIAGGSVVMETIMPGTEHEMVTMYHRDGEDFVLTHYCAALNEPHMKAKKGGDAGKIEFEFAGGANIDPKKDTHMHDSTITFKDADHVTSEWVLWVGGEKKETKIFSLTRMKK